jgi:cysteinyl-tRNA synthetase
MVARSFRLMTLQSLYRDNFNFGFDRLVSCGATIRSFDDFFRRLQRTDFHIGKVRRNFSSNLQAIIQDYSECLFDDFRSNDALVSVHEAIGYFQREIDMGSLNLSEKNAIVSLFETLDSVL